MIEWVKVDLPQTADDENPINTNKKPPLHRLVREVVWHSSQPAAEESDERQKAATREARRLQVEWEDGRRERVRKQQELEQSGMIPVPEARFRAHQADLARKNEKKGNKKPNKTRGGRAPPPEGTSKSAPTPDVVGARPTTSAKEVLDALEEEDGEHLSRVVHVDEGSSQEDVDADLREGGAEDVGGAAAPGEVEPGGGDAVEDSGGGDAEEQQSAQDRTQPEEAEPGGAAEQEVPRTMSRATEQVEQSQEKQQQDQETSEMNAAGAAVPAPQKDEEEADQDQAPDEKKNPEEGLIPKALVKLHAQTLRKYKVLLKNSLMRPCFEETCTKFRETLINPVLKIRKSIR
eukprot:g4092.t1